MPDTRTALITGANKGIGLEIARQLGGRGIAVRLGCRDHARGDEAAAGLRAAGIDARVLVIDVADDAGVRDAAAALAAEIEALDILVNNAGISIGTPQLKASEETADDLRAMLEVNTLGPLRVTQAFLPLLRRSDAARVVMMSSGLGSVADTGDLASLVWPVGYAGYSATKAALNMLTVKLAKELAVEGIKVNAADPGYTATDLNHHSGPRSVEDAARIAVDLATLDALGPTGGFFNDGHAARLSRLPW